MSDMIAGTLDMLILKSLSLAPMHGFGITKRIEQISKGVFKVNPGSLLLAFQRMERDGLIEPDWRATENNRRAKYYGLTNKGRKQLKSETREWERRTAAVARLLEA
ncbi:MAG: PadR family transcriptional regulator [bacterium]